jgi:preprotein translocase subunit YajC
MFSGNPLLGPIFMYGAIFAIFYFILIRPGQKQRKAHEAMLRDLRKGDEIVTTGGVIGTVIFIKDSTANDPKATGEQDRVIIKSEDTRLAIERGRIARISRAITSSGATVSE